MCTAVDLEGAQVATTRWRGWVGSGVWCAPHGRGIRPEVIVVVLETDGETHVCDPAAPARPDGVERARLRSFQKSSLVSSTRLSERVVPASFVTVLIAPRASPRKARHGPGARARVHV